VPIENGEKGGDSVSRAKGEYVPPCALARRRQAPPRTFVAFGSCCSAAGFDCVRHIVRLCSASAAHRPLDERDELLKRFIAPLFAVAALALPAAAVADSCSNVSRAPAPCGFTCTGPVIDGNWVWLPSIGVPVAAWGFAPPGAADSTGFGFPGANGNYTNGQTSSLLGMSHNCPPGSNTNRQTAHGIQSGCE
jgi:hypothetical protein